MLISVLTGDYLHLQRQQRREQRQEPRVMLSRAPTVIQNQVWNSHVPYSLMVAVLQNWTTLTQLSSLMQYLLRWKYRHYITSVRLQD